MSLQMLPLVDHTGTTENMTGKLSLLDWVIFTQTNL